MVTNLLTDATRKRMAATAESMQKEIDSKLIPPKPGALRRVNEAERIERDVRHLRRVQAGLRALATGQGVPDILWNVSTRVQVSDILFYGTYPGSAGSIDEQDRLLKAGITPSNYAEARYALCELIDRTQGLDDDASLGAALESIGVNGQEEAERPVELIVEAPGAESEVYEPEEVGEARAARDAEWGNALIASSDYEHRSAQEEPWLAPIEPGEAIEGEGEGEPEPEQQPLIPKVRPKGELLWLRLADLPPDSELGPAVPSKAFIQSVTESGVQTPVIVLRRSIHRKLPGDEWQVAAGRRRIKAARLVGLEHIPARVYEQGQISLDATAIIENTQRSEHPATMLEHVQSLLRGGYPESEVRAITGWTKPQWTKRMGILGLNDTLLQAYFAGSIAEGVAASAAHQPRARQRALAEQYAETGKLTADDVKAARNVVSEGAVEALPQTLWTPVELNGLAPAPSPLEVENWQEAVVPLLETVLMWIPEERYALRNQITGALNSVRPAAIPSNGTAFDPNRPPDSEGFPVEELDPFAPFQATKAPWVEATADPLGSEFHSLPIAQLPEPRAGSVRKDEDDPEF